MLKKILVCTALVTLAMANPVSSQQSSPTSDQAKRIEAMVNKAAELVDTKGKVAFSEFRKRDSEWWFDNTYLFVYDNNMNVLLNPAFPQREGTNVHDDKDVNGKLFHDEFMKVIHSKGSGWVDFVHYSSAPQVIFWYRAIALYAKGYSE